MSRQAIRALIEHACLSSACLRRRRRRQNDGLRHDRSVYMRRCGRARSSDRRPATRQPCFACKLLSNGHMPVGSGVGRGGTSEASSGRRTPTHAQTRTDVDADADLADQQWLRARSLARPSAEFQRQPGGQKQSEDGSGCEHLTDWQRQKDDHSVIRPVLAGG